MFFHIFFTSDEQAVMRRAYKGATVFCRKEGDTWCAAIAFCAPQDQFNRRVGRSQARRRYFQVMQHSQWPEAWLERLGPDKPLYDHVKLMAVDMAIEGL
jgi:hypothetical protein